MQTSSRSAQLRQSVLLGVGTGLALSVIAGLLLLAEDGAAALSQTVASWMRISSTYVVLGAVAGLVVGLFRPLGETWLGAAVLGFLVALVAYGAIEFIPDPLGREESTPALRDVFVLAVLVGPAAGVAIRFVSKRLPSDP